jgi:hypothetical protein
MTPAQKLHEILEIHQGSMCAYEAEMIASIAPLYPVVVCLDNAGRRHVQLKDFKKFILTLDKDSINDIYFWLPVHVLLCAILDIPHDLSTKQQQNKLN